MDPHEDQAPPAHPQTNANNHFAFSLFQNLHQVGKNLLLSPLSVSTVLSMAYAGAKGETAQQFEAVLGFSSEENLTHEGFKTILDEIETPSTTPTQISMANAIWTGKEVTLLPEYVDLMREFYSGGLQTVDFSHPEEARKIINEWTEEKTRKMIVELLKEKDINALTELILTNALTFKGTWEVQFDPAKTHQATFHTHGGPVEADFMEGEPGQYLGYANEWVQILTHFYKGDQYGMILFLPRPEHTLEEVIAKMSFEVYDELTENMEMIGITEFKIPRFTMETRTDLEEILSELGMPVPFSSQANFSGLNGKTNLSLSKIIHQTKITVNEAGTEASAGTAAVFPRGNIPEPFIANKPFLYVIADLNAENVVFIGKVENPAG